MFERRHALIVVAVFVVVALGCLWGGAVPEAAAQTIQVLSAYPDTAEQGTLSLPVTIKGNGFKKGAKAKFYLPNTSDTGGITVSSTRFIDSTQLVATIDVAGTATVAKFDIVVANTDGRTGKGTEMFTVQKKVDPCMVPDPVPTRTALTADVAGFPGFLDGRFGAGTGQVVSPLGFRGFQRTGVAIQVVGGERKIVAAGVMNDSYCTNDGQTTLKWAVVRYRPDGSRDTSFGNGGVVTTVFTGGSAYAADLAIDALNRIVVVGAAPAKRGTGRIPTAVRYKENGSVDTTFGSGGVAAIPFGRDNGYANTVAVQADGKIVIVAEVTDAPHLAVIRLDNLGALDSSFNGTGKFVDARAAVSFGLNVTTQWIGTEQRIVVAGRFADTSFNTHWIGALWRFTSTGALDSGFGSGGVALTDFNPTGRYEDSATHYDVAVDGMNRLVVAVNLSTWQPAAGRSLNEVAVARFLETGSPDATFGITGMTILPSSTSGSYGSFARALAVQRDGRIVVVGTTYPGSDSDPSELAAWRIAGDGVLDVSFGNGGWISHPVTTEPRSAVSLDGLVEAPDGTFVAAGNAWFGEGWITYGFLARFWQ